MLEDILKNLVENKKNWNKPVVATGNVHYLEEEDALYRDILGTAVEAQHTKPTSSF